MTAVAFDTLKFAQTLRDKAHVPQDQAEGMAEAFAAATSEQITTKADLKETEIHIDAKISEVKSELRETEVHLDAKISEVKSELRETELRLDAKISEVQLRLDAKISEVKSENLLTKWMMGFVLAFQVAIFVKLFLH